MGEDSTDCRTSFLTLEVIACWGSAAFKDCEIMDVDEPRMLPHAFGISACAIANARKDSSTAATDEFRRPTSRSGLG